ncbi:hypothetical protein AAEX28_00080 [Lentisphaerota bacterium WC36G]|nr:hypothetical protein LJT99_02955 [Lentisphaerae bacterium WC36]
MTRAFFLVEWLKSPLRGFNEFASLDMANLLNWGVDFFEKPFEFSPFFLLIYTLSKFFDSANLLIVYVVFQLIFSVLIVYFVAQIAKKITGNYFIALLSAVLVAFYSPLLLYCGVFLREVMYVLLGTMSLYFLIYYRNNKKAIIYFSIFIGLFYGVRVAAITWVISAFIWLIVRELITANHTGKLNNFSNCFSTIFNNKFLKRLVLCCVTIAVGILIFNTVKNRKLLTNFDNYPYYYNVGSQEQINSLDVVNSNGNQYKEKNKTSSFKAYFVKTKQLFTAYLLPNNINYYFWRGRLGILKIMLGVVVFYSLAVTSIIFNFKRFCLKKEAVLGYFCVSFALPLIVFVPLGRYSLIFIAPFAIYSAIFLHQLVFLFVKKQYLRFLIAIILLATITSIYYKILNQKGNLERSSDYVGLIAIYEKNRQKDSEALIKTYQKAHQIFPNNSYFVYHYAQNLLKNNQVNDAKKILITFNNNPQGQKKFDSILLLSAILMTQEQYNEALMQLEKFDAKQAYERQKNDNNVNLQYALYCDLYGDAIMRHKSRLSDTKRKQIAVLFYKNALRLLDKQVTSHQKLIKIIELKMEKINKNK